MKQKERSDSMWRRRIVRSALIYCAVLCLAFGVIAHTVSEQIPAVTYDSMTFQSPTTGNAASGHKIVHSGSNRSYVVLIYGSIRRLGGGDALRDYSDHERMV